MAKRVLDRRKLRAEQEEAEPKVKTAAKKERAHPDKKKAPAKGAPAAKVRKPRKKKVVRLCARWGVYDAGMKQLAVFDYNQRAQADQKVRDLTAKKTGYFFLQIIKEPMPEPEVEKTT